MNKDEKYKIISKYKDLVLDTGILIEYLGAPDAESIKWLDEFIFTENSQFLLHSHEINRTEILYLICRKKGMKNALNIVKSMEKFIFFHNDPEISEIAGNIKCKYSIALADCFSIATGTWLKSPIIFKKEHELENSVIKSIENEFNVKLVVF
ncbi:MAG: PIN domain-containing protein [Candidatus Helarchaeota archaeon]